MRWLAGLAGSQKKKQLHVLPWSHPAFFSLTLLQNSRLSITSITSAIAIRGIDSGPTKGSISVCISHAPLS